MDDFITLNDERGREVQFEYLDSVIHEEDEYLILLPVERDEDDVEGQVVIL